VTDIHTPSIFSGLNSDFELEPVRFHTCSSHSASGERSVDEVIQGEAFAHRLFTCAVPRIRLAREWVLYRMKTSPMEDTTLTGYTVIQFSVYF
jgi:hypothetical protein